MIGSRRPPTLGSTRSPTPAPLRKQGHRSDSHARPSEPSIHVLGVNSLAPQAVPEVTLSRTLRGEVRTLRILPRRRRGTGAPGPHKQPDQRNHSRNADDQTPCQSAELVAPHRRSSFALQALSLRPPLGRNSRLSHTGPGHHQARRARSARWRSTAEVSSRRTRSACCVQCAVAGNRATSRSRGA